MPLVGLSSSYYAFQGFSVYDSVKRASGLGFETIELGAAHSFEKGIWQSLKRIKKDFKMNFTLHGLFPPLEEKLWFNLSLGLTAQNKKIFENMFKAAELMEAVCVTVHPGYLSETKLGNVKDGMDYGFAGTAIPREKVLEGLLSSVDFAMKLSKKTGICFGIENVPKSNFTSVVYSVGEFRNFFSKFEEAGFLLDMGHALSESRLEELLVFRDKIIEMHVHFSRPTSESVRLDEHKPLPSEDSISFMKTIKQIKKIPLVFEHGTSVSGQEILAEKELLEKFLAKI